MENNIVYDAYYLISLFLKDNKEVTQLHIQKLMYFFEAYYMNVKDTNQLYDCNFCAWAYGPVAIPLYKSLKRFGSQRIELTDEEKSYGDTIEKEKKRLLNNIYNVFKDVPAMTLVEYTHMAGSPWKEVWERNEGKVGYGAETYIDKLKTKRWFKDVFQRQD